jgi:hypothetical protein
MGFSTKRSMREVWLGFRGLLDLGHDDGAFVAVGFVEGGELGEGVLADDVGVEDEEGLVVLSEGLLGELERAGSA